jgi:glycerol uptake facilitator-like aquaporin
MSEPIPKRDYLCSKRQFGMELFGTFAIVYCGGMAVTQVDLGNSTVFGVAIQTTFLVTVVCWAGAGICGAHYNGAVSFCLTITGHIGWKKF